MPSLAHVAIPVLSPSPSSGNSTIGKGKASLKSRSKPRNYSDDPLPIKPSDAAPRKARIVGRYMDFHGAFYQLKIGDVELNEVGIDEILEYVSAQHLEEYENQQFEEEAELIRITEAEEARQELEEERRDLERQQRREEKALRKGTATYEGLDGADDGVVTSGDAGEAIAGKHGRVRPSYKHLFKKMKERRRRRRDPVTGELMPLSDDDDDDMAAVESSEDESPALVKTHGELPDPMKRRRRKRDPVTGELLPLDPVPKPIDADERADQKQRRRRRRHPVTGELMPIGWRYDPNAPSASKPSSGRHGDMGVMSPAMKRLSISQEHAAKRMKLGRQSSSAESSSANMTRRNVVQSMSTSDHSSGDDEEDTLAKATSTLARSNPKPLPTAARGRLGLPAALQSAAASSMPESSPERNTMMPMAHSTAAQMISNENSDDDDLQEGEWHIEAILAHHMSDPKTHARELGKKPVMLYQVKWENYGDPSWEPIESFPDRSVVDDYHRRVDQNLANIAGNHENGKERKSNIGTAAPASKSRQAQLSPVRVGSIDSRKAVDREHKEEKEDGEDEDVGDTDTYVVERILAHHMSDPKTHGPDFGREPTMLYQVKWKGFETLTWEPMDSFEDRKVVHSYRRKAGLADIEDEDENDDEDEDME